MKGKNNIQMLFQMLLYELYVEDNVVDTGRNVDTTVGIYVHNMVVCIQYTHNLPIRYSA